MAHFVVLFCLVISTATATTPVVNETDDSIIPTAPATSVPRRCPPNEELKLRGSCPPDSCDMLYMSVLCIANQTKELLCTCKPGYLRRNTTCVPEDRCLPPECAHDPNAIRGCGNRCGKTCADYNTTQVCKNNVCHVNGCDCRDGFVYDQNTKKCVKPEQCTKQCKGSYEIYIDCPAGQCKAKTCDDLVNPPGCPRIKPPCPGGCVCKHGYLRDKSGNCIPKEQCPCLQCKKKNERWSNCVIGECVPRTCEDVGYPVSCPDIIGPCAGGCTCIEGFVRNCTGDCIDMKNCPSCGGDPNAVSGCGNTCGNTCARLYTNNSDLICPEYCEYNGCDCKPGYRLLTNNTESKKCVPEKECPKPACGVNEQYYCGTSCPEASCVNPTPPTCVNKKCKLGCFCKKGFVRDSNNICVPVNKCTKCKGPHERLISCPAGQCIPKTCKDLIIPPGCPRVLPPCPDGCICEEGYLRDANGKCIKKSLCPKASCKANETYVLCAVKCPDKYCPKIDGPQPVCDPPKPCPPGCICKVNYRYDQSGKCILASECPPLKCKDPNAIWDSCPSACLNEQCEATNSPPVTCNTLLLNCNPRCVCKPGYFKHPETGLCVPAKECPGVCKDPNASWKNCRDPCPGTCQNTKPICLNKACSPGCQCNEGYVLSKLGKGGKCVKIETCADYAHCPANQTFVHCTFKCPQVMCPKSDQTILCKPPRDCPGGCGCKPYYRYDANGNCIKAADCPPVECTRTHEAWTCKHIGDWENCDERYNSPPFWPGDPDDCEPKCACEKGYWRNPQTNKCVTENECPPITE
ncbi:zonadhesin-like isoform X1 [Cydia pomonella]|uniref:zonadhesin-like isoform X1 n=1 Tax=Cydia pomonella TaxID=82600 RepID=UPI002ADE26C6|nr:zonadhesin-like isoform X1 [Cydia pomonella]